MTTNFSNTQMEQGLDGGDNTITPSNNLSPFPIASKTRLVRPKSHYVQNKSAAGIPVSRNVEQDYINTHRISERYSMQTSSNEQGNQFNIKEKILKKPTFSKFKK